MRTFRFGLTGRGLTLLLAGIAVTAGASAIGEPDLAWLGVFLSTLPIIGLLMVLFLSPKLTSERTIIPESVPIGGTARANLAVTNERATAFAALGFSDLIPHALGRNASFELAKGIGRWHQAAGYDVAARQRGHFLLGPLRVRNHDPFGTAWRSWQVSGTPTSMRVTPHLWELSLPRGGRAAGASGEATPQRIGAAGPDDVLVREHRHGDGMRRVHWKMSAKRGELMVRLEEQPWDPTMTILIDTRERAHIGEGPDCTLEWVISFGASLATELLHERLRVSVLGADGVIFSPIYGETMSSSTRLLNAVTEITASPRSSLEDCLADPDDLGSPQTVVAGLGLLTSRDAAAMVAATTRVSQLDALVPDARAFRQPVELVTAHDEACRLLRSSGWNLATYGPQTTVTQAWQLLSAQREAR